MKNIIYACVLTFSIFGCSTTYKAMSGDEKFTTPDDKYLSVNERIRDYSVCIVLKDSTEYFAEKFQIGRDSSLVVTESNGSIIISNSAIRSIRTVEHEIGGIEGFGLGICAGLGCGFAYLELSNAVYGTRNTFGGLIIIGVTGVGAITGTIVGAEIGHSFIYEFN
jgi:hypothetical protein